MEATEVLAGKQIHKASIGGGPLCGIDKPVRISYSGALLLVTCPDCIKAMTPDPAAQWASLEAAAARFRGRQ